jgi:hypothetical protein
MAEVQLTQAEADALLAMEKQRVDDTAHLFPMLGGSLSVPLMSPDRREQFVLDIGRGRIDLSKVTYQNRARTVVILARLDIAGPSHRNPDGTEMPCPHLHLYREGFADKWAFPVPDASFSNLADLWMTLDDFMRYCNVTKTPFFQKALL